MEPVAAAASGKGGGNGDTRPVATGAAEPDEPFEIRGAIYEATVLLNAARSHIPPGASMATSSVSLSTSIDLWLNARTSAR